MDEENQPNHNEIQAQWASVRGKVRQKIGDALFKSWFKPLSLVSFNSGKLGEPYVFKSLATLLKLKFWQLRRTVTVLSTTHVGNTKSAHVLSIENLLDFCRNCWFIFERYS